MTALVEPLFAPFECAPSGEVDLVFDLVNHDDGFALFDGLGRRRWTGRGPELGATLWKLVERESRRVGRRLGGFDALLVGSALVLPEPGVWRGLARALGEAGLEALGAPVFLSARDELRVSTSRLAIDGVVPDRIVAIETGRELVEDVGELDPASAVRLLFGAARDGGPCLAPMAARTFASWLARTPRRKLVAKNVAAAARRFGEQLAAAPALASGTRTR